MPKYAPNPFASGAAGMPQQQAYASALRNYAPNQGYATNPFEQASPTPPMQLAPHLSRTGEAGNEYGALSPEMLNLYRSLGTDPVQGVAQPVPDLDRLWRVSPGASVFKEGYQHNPYVLEHLRQRRLAARTPEEIEQERQSMAFVQDSMTGGT